MHVSVITNNYNGNLYFDFVNKLNFFYASWNVSF